MMVHWENLPDFMKTEEVRPYYNMLKKHIMGFLVKRTFDFLVSSIMIVFMMPVFIFLAILIKIDSKGPIFYRQERVTQYGRIFKIWKFRTMVQNADKIGSLVTVSSDPRITKIGRLLRGYRLDELPQLINIWKGEMTFVGTRPEVPKYVNKYTNEMYATLLLPAGVTSKASIEFRNEDQMLEGINGDVADQIYIEKVLPKKMRWNLEGILNFSILNDLSVLLKTIVIIIN